jgi:hypothetical protein
MHSIKTLIAVTTCSSLLTGCMYFGGSIEECSEVDAPVSRVVPTERSSLTMAILPVTDELTNTTDNGAAEVLQAKLKAVAADRGLGLVNEDRFPDIESSIRLLDTGGMPRPSSDTSLQVLKAVVTGANLTYRFEEAKTAGDAENPRTIPSMCTITARIDIEARLYTGSPLQRTLTIPFSGTHQQKIASEDPDCATDLELYNDLYRAAATEVAKSVESLKTNREMFSEQSYVQELRICYNKKRANFVWLSSGPDGISDPGTKVNIYRQYWFKDKLKNEVSIRRKFITSAKITTSENPTEIWAKISNLSNARKIMLGDIAVLNE